MTLMSPNQPKTPVRGVRLPDPIWDEVRATAAAEGIAPSDVMRDRLELGEVELPPHTCQHVAYRLSCDDFDALMARAGGACELCRTPHHRLQHDHDHDIGWHGVRGLLCPKCNAHMRRVDSGERVVTEPVQKYLDNAWHLTHPSKPRRHAQPSTSDIYSVRVPDALQDAFKEAAAHRGETATAALIRAMQSYVNRNHPDRLRPKDRPTQPPPHSGVSP
jgi:hypothetical protein